MNSGHQEKNSGHSGTAGADFERSRSDFPGSSVACSPEKFYNLRFLEQHFLHFQTTLD